MINLFRKFTIFILLLVIMGCSTIYQPLPEGKPTTEPFGYIIYCIENPDSIFCNKKEK